MSLKFQNFTTKLNRLISEIKINSRFKASKICFFLLALLSNGQSQWIKTNGPCRGNILISAKGNDLFAGTKDGIYRSSNNGVNWLPASNGFNGTVTGFANIDENIFAFSKTILYGSIDNGVNWNQLPMGGSSPAICANGKILYVDGAYRSLDSGKTWKTLDANGLISKRNTLMGFGTYLLAGTSEGVMISTDSGMNWKSMIVGLPSKKNIVSFAKIGTNIFCATSENGVFLSTDSGQSWTAKNNGLTSLKVNVLLAKAGSLFAGTNLGIGRSDNKGNDWFSISDSLPKSIDIQSLVSVGTNLFVGTTESGLFRINENGINWNYIYEGLPKIPISSIDNGMVFSSAGSGVYRTEDNGLTWSAINSGLTNLNVVSLAGNYAATDAGVFSSLYSNNIWNWHQIYGGKVKSLNLQVDGLTLFTDNGQYKSDLSTPFTLSKLNSDTCIISRLFSGNNYFELSSCSQNSLFLSLDSGKKSFSLKHNWPSQYEVLSHSIIGSNLFIGTNGGGIFFSSTNGDTWTPINTGITLISTVHSLGTNGVNLFAGINDENVYRLQILQAPSLISPGNNAYSIPRNPVFTWESTSNAKFYKIQISNSPQFEKIIFEDSTLTTTSKSFDTLQKDTTFYWRVEAKNEWGFRLYSTVWKFSTGSTTIIRNKIFEVKSSVWSIEPITSERNEFQLKLMIPVKGLVGVRIMNSDGKEFLNLSQHLEPGEYIIRKDGFTPSGLYCQIISSGKLVMSRKL